jgi:hypothetical protein
MKVGVTKIKSRLRCDGRRTEEILRDGGNDVEEKLFLIEKTPTHRPNTVGLMPLQVAGLIHEQNAAFEEWI